ncbi:MAG: hypothetical protein IJF42_04090 [Clostridia bacterium]|nr:hypothetical protein [Clostridia bacterium]
MPRNNAVGKLAIGGVMTALAVVALLLSLVPMTEYMMPALAGAMLLPVVMECGRRWAVGSYVAAALLALLLTPSLEAKVLFVAFFGYYSIAKAWLEGHFRPWLRWTCKFALFNIAVCVSYWLMLQFFSLDPAVFDFFGVSLPPLLLLFGNVAFLMYDFLLTALVTVYWQRLHPVFARMFGRRR